MGNQPSESLGAPIMVLTLIQSGASEAERGKSEALERPKDFLQTIAVSDIGT